MRLRFSARSEKCDCYRNRAACVVILQLKGRSPKRVIRDRQHQASDFCSATGHLHVPRKSTDKSGNNDPTHVRCSVYDCITIPRSFEVESMSRVLGNSQMSTSEPLTASETLDDWVMVNPPSFVCRIPKLIESTGRPHRLHPQRRRLRLAQNHRRQSRAWLLFLRLRRRPLPHRRPARRPSRRLHGLRALRLLPYRIF